MGAGPSTDLQRACGESPVDPKRLGAALTAWCKPLNWGCSPPFLVGWYNEARKSVAGGSQLIEAEDAALAFALYSVPCYLDVLVEHYARVRPAKDFVDSATDEILGWIRDRLPDHFEALIVNTDAGPPYYHVQTIGAVAAVDEHIEAEHFQEPEDEAWRKELGDLLEDTRDPKMWGLDAEGRRKIFGVNLHPTWGGWYAYRGLVVLRGVTAELQKPAPLKFLASAEAKRVLYDYNVKPAECRWRDLTADGHPPERRYSPAEYFFFHETSQDKRRRFLELSAAAQFGGNASAVPKPRVA